MMDKHIPPEIQKSFLQAAQDTANMLGLEVDVTLPDGRRTMIAPREPVEPVLKKGEPKLLGVVGKCYSCKKSWNITSFVRKGELSSVRCSDCQGFVILPKGTSILKTYYSGEEMDLLRHPVLKEEKI